VIGFILKRVTKENKKLIRKTIIKNHENIAFLIFIDNHFTAAKEFDLLFYFLIYIYFSKIAFELVYFLNKKIYAFTDRLSLIKFKDTNKNLRPTNKCRKIILE
jgi:hypothetical protein